MKTGDQFLNQQQARKIACETSTLMYDYTMESHVKLAVSHATFLAFYSKIVRLLR